MKARFIFHGLLLLLVAGGGAAWAGAAEARYTITDLGVKTQAKRINAAGDVAGTTTLPGSEFRAFWFSKGKMHDLGTLGGAISVASGLGDDGTVVGSSRTGEPGQNGRPANRPFVYAEGVMREVAVTGLEAGVRLGEVNDINGTGMMAGRTDERRGRLCIVDRGRATVATTPADFTRAEDINGLEVKRINAAGQVIGILSAFRMTKTGPHSSAQTDTRRHGFLYTGGRIEDLGEFFPADIDSAGRMVGSRRGKDGKGQTVFYDGKEFHELGKPAGFESGSVVGINTAGLMVGSGSTVTGGGFLWIGVNSHAFIYEQGQWRDLNDLVVLAGTGLTSLFQAEGINDRGQIICQAMGEGGYHAVLLTPVESAKPGSR